MNGKRQDDDVGCLGCLVELIVLGLISRRSSRSPARSIVRLNAAHRGSGPNTTATDLADRFPTSVGHVAVNLPHCCFG
jgi:hypothetical protein